MESQGNGAEQFEIVARNLLGDYGWMFIAGLSILMFQSSVKKLAAGLFVFWVMTIKQMIRYMLMENPGVLYV